MAMIMVILLSLVMLLVPIALASAVAGQLPLTRHDQNYAAALPAAEAGAQDFINRLNANNSYWQTTVATTAAGGSVTGTGTPPNPGDNNKALLGWVPVSSITPLSLVEGYCYTVDQTGSNGIYTSDSTISSVQGIVALTVYGYASAAGSLPATQPGANPCVAPVPARSALRRCGGHAGQPHHS